MFGESFAEAAKKILPYVPYFLLFVFDSTMIICAQHLFLGHKDTVSKTFTEAKQGFVCAYVFDNTMIFCNPLFMKFW
jgi:hypothetical protein